MSPDVILFFRNIAYAAPIIVALCLAGAKWLQCTRFEREVYWPFQARMAEEHNADPAIRQAWVNIVIYGICAAIIVSLFALTKNYLFTALFTVGLILTLGIWDLRSLPQQHKRREAWIKSLHPEDKALIRAYQKMRLQLALIIVAGIAYGFFAMRFLP